MDGRAVEALVVVLDHDLPVRRDLADGLVGGAELAEPEPLVLDDRPLALRGQAVAQPVRRLSEVHEDEALPDLDRDRPEAVFGPVDLVFLHERRADQLSVERIAPGVVAALDRAAQATGRLLVTQARPAMTTDVVEATQLAVLAPYDEDALPDHIDGKKIAGFGERVDPARIDPVPEEDLLPFDGEDLRRVVITTGKREAGPPMAIRKSTSSRRPNSGANDAAGDAHSVGVRSIDHGPA